MRRTFRRGTLLLAIVVAAVLLAIGVAMAAEKTTPAETQATNTSKIGHEKTLTKVPAKERTPPSKPLQEAKNVPTLSANNATADNSVDPIDGKVLVLSANGKEADLPAIKNSLDYLGVPYKVWVATDKPGGLTADQLWDGNVHAYYQGVILATGDLGYADDSGNWMGSALTEGEWQALREFEANFKIRQVSWYTYPISPNDYGFKAESVGGVDTTSSPLSATFKAGTDASNKVWDSYVNLSKPLSISNVYAYTAQPAADDANGKNTPVLTDSSGNALGLIRNYTDGRQNLALTFDSNQYLRHNQVLGYGLVNWVTKGLFLGERHVYMDPQPDDVFIADDLWSKGGQPPPCGTDLNDVTYGFDTYRMSGNDLKAVMNWQKATSSKGIVMEMPFNGIGTTSAYLQDNKLSDNGLTNAARNNQKSFKWINHTWDHENLNPPATAGPYMTTVTNPDGTTSQKQQIGATAELINNDNLANNWGLTKYKKQSLITPDISGLDNPDVMKAAYNFGIRNVVSDTSKTGTPNNGPNPTPNAGFYNSWQPGILTIPRYPTNLFFNVSKPEEWVAEYNCLYGANGSDPTRWGKDLTYSEILDKESDRMLGYLLTGDINPLMFHQANLRAYDGTHTLLTDLIDATLKKYNNYFTLPIQSPTQNDLATKVSDRMAYNASGVSTSVVPKDPSTGSGGSITITAQKAAKVPVTGLNASGTGISTESYGGQSISYVTLKAGQSVTLPQTQY